MLGKQEIDHPSRILKGFGIPRQQTPQEYKSITDHGGEILRGGSPQHQNVLSGIQHDLDHV